MIPERFPATLIDRISFLLTTRIETQIVNGLIELTGRIDEERLGRAIRLVMDAEPIVGCRFVPHWHTPYWQRRTDLDTLPLCEVVAGDESCPAFARYLVQAIDPSSAPLLQAAVFRGATDTVCLKFSHTAGDAQAYLRLAEMVATLYRRLADEPDYRPTPNVTAVRHPRKLAEGLTLAQRVQFFRRASAGYKVPDETWLFPPVCRERPFRAYAFLRLPKERAAALAAYGRRRRASTTCVFMTALYLATRRPLSPRCRRRGDPGGHGRPAQYLRPADRPTGIINMSGPLPSASTRGTTRSSTACSSRSAGNCGSSSTTPRRSARRSA